MKQRLLKEVAVWVEIQKERGKIAYTFRLHDSDLYSVPPGESFIKVRTFEYAEVDR